MKNYKRDTRENKLHIVWEDLQVGIKDPLVLLAQGLGSGCIYPMTGSWGTLAGLVVYYFFFQLLPQEVWLGLVALACLGGIPLCTYAEKKLHSKDPHSVVWDEWCGIWLALSFLPQNWLFMGVGFFVFRWLDIKKPFIIGWADRNCAKGLGIMLDDIFAGLATAIILALLSILLGAVI